jgi:hypothetical protein
MLTKNDKFPKIEKTINPNIHFFEPAQVINPIIKELTNSAIEIFKSMSGYENILFSKNFLSTF